MDSHVKMLRLNYNGGQETPIHFSSEIDRKRSKIAENCFNCFHLKNVSKKSFLKKHCSQAMPKRSDAFWRECGSKAFDNENLKKFSTWIKIWQIIGFMSKCISKESSRTPDIDLSFARSGRLSRKGRKEKEFRSRGFVRAFPPNEI